MVATGYEINRVFGLIISIGATLISLSQIILLFYLHQNNKNSKKTSLDIKCYIHFGCLFTSFLLMIHFIDIFGIFGILPFILQKIVISYSLRGVQSSLCIVIWGHFSAHYNSLKKMIPSIFAQFLFISLTINIIGSTIGLILTAVVNGMYFKIENSLQFLWVISLLVIDLYGYCLVRTLLIELREYRRNLSHSTTTTTASTSNNLNSNGNSNKNKNSSGHTTDTQDLLSRIQRYHFLFTFLCSFYGIFTLINLITKKEPVFIIPNPNHFEIGQAIIYLPYTYFILHAFLTWWAWTPIHQFTEVIKNSSISKNSHHYQQPIQKITTTTTTTAMATVEVVTIDHSENDKETKSLELTKIEKEKLERTPSSEKLLLASPSKSGCSNEDNNVPTLSLDDVDRNKEKTDREIALSGTDKMREIEGEERKEREDQIKLNDSDLSSSISGVINVINVTIGEDGQIVASTK